MTGSGSKFVITAVVVNRIFLKASFSFFPSTERNTKNSRTIKNGSTKCTEIMPNPVEYPRRSPNRAAPIINIGCSFVTVFNVFSSFQVETILNLI